MDPLADMLIQIKNAGAVGKKIVSVPYSKFKFMVAQILLREGYVFLVNKRGKGPKRSLEITLSYEGGKSKLNGVKRVSKPSRRIYADTRSIKRVRQGTGEVVLSTPKGILTGKEARKEKAGGEVLFEVW